MTRIPKIMLAFTLCILLAGTAFGASTSTSAAGGKEAPALADMVKAGTLPPLEQRIPQDPWVIKPLNAAGKYGGVLKTYFTGPGDWAEYGHMETPYMLYINSSYNGFIPMIAKSFQFSPDAKTLTLTLRRGMKWSDGKPVVADDIMFWWNDMVNDKDLNGSYGWMAGAWVTGSQPPKFTKVDDLTVRIDFAIPNRPILATLASWRGGLMTFIVPSHYLKQFHMTYNPKADDDAKAAGKKDWVDQFNTKNNWPGPAYDDPAMPTLAPWIIVSQDTSRRVYTRNPYYWAVDSDGRQLPYIDGLDVQLITDRNIIALKAMNGELDMDTKATNTNDLALYKDNEKKGNYTTRLWSSAVSSNPVFAFNQNAKDPVLQKIFQDVRFRQAMSVSINRAEINKIVFSGLGTPTQATVAPSASYYNPAWGKSYAQYDPALANKLLDAMGLSKKNSDGVRLRPDGKPLELNVWGSGNKPVELVKGYWDAVGVKTNLLNWSNELYQQNYQTGNIDVGVWGTDRMLEFAAYIPNATKFSMDSELAWAMNWKAWWDKSKGLTPMFPNDPIEPPAAVKAYLKTLDDWYAAKSDAEYASLAKKVWQFHADNLYVIGTVGFVPSPTMITNRLENIPQKITFTDELAWLSFARPEQWFFK